MRGEASRSGFESNADLQFTLLLHQRRDELDDEPLTGEAYALDRTQRLYTRPDVMFPSAAVFVYLDGPHHRNSIHAQRDEVIDGLLEGQGIVSIRYDYYPPISKQSLEKVFRKVKAVVHARMLIPKTIIRAADHWRTS